MEDREHWLELFKGFLDAPNECWQKESDQGLDIQMIVSETLRLYPPTPRMYMQQESGELSAVDIESMHREGEKWGAEVLKFRPERWIGDQLDVVDTDFYMPFGRKVNGEMESTSISQCPSRLRGGPKLIAVIVGSLLEVLDEKWMLEVGRTEDNVFGEGPLRSGRDTYQSLRLRRKGGMM